MTLAVSFRPAAQGDVETAGQKAERGSAIYFQVQAEMLQCREGSTGIFRKQQMGETEILPLQSLLEELPQ